MKSIGWFGIFATLFFIQVAQAEWRSVTMRGVYYGNGLHQPGIGPCRFAFNSEQLMEQGGDVALEISFNGNDVSFRLAGAWFADLGPIALGGAGHEIPPYFATTEWPEEQAPHMGRNRLYVLSLGSQFVLVRVSAMEIEEWRRERQWYVLNRYRASCSLTFDYWYPLANSIADIEMLLARLTPEDFSRSEVASFDEELRLDKRYKAIHRAAGELVQPSPVPPSRDAAAAVWRQAKVLLAVLQPHLEGLRNELAVEETKLARLEEESPSQSWWQRIRQQRHVGPRSRIKRLRSEVDAWAGRVSELQRIEAELLPLVVRD